MITFIFSIFTVGVFLFLLVNESIKYKIDKDNIQRKNYFKY